MSKTYYTLAEREDGVWFNSFGSYVWGDVRGELDDRRAHDVRARDLKILKTSDEQAAIDAEISKLNAPSIDPRPTLLRVRFNPGANLCETQEILERVRGAIIGFDEIAYLVSTVPDVYEIEIATDLANIGGLLQDLEAEDIIHNTK